MALTVNANTAASSAITQLGRTDRRLARAYERVSSGLRISRAADDAAGLGVAENLRVAFRSARVAQRNVGDGISMISVAEGASTEVASILGRMRELAVQGASETLDDAQRAYIQDEFVALSAEVDRISAVTEFNGINLTDASITGGVLAVQVGIHNTASDQIEITLGDLSASTLGVDTGTIDMSTSALASTALTDIDAAITIVSGYRSDYGAAENRLGNSLSNLERFTENTVAAESAIRDADFGYEAVEMAKSQILQQAGVAVLAQAKRLNEGVLQLLQA
ncbi:MAG: flagellin FliC [Deltaproteobacteria bacterium]|nr:flagellin FliC [Deltaproteobacteria bacterium]